MNEYYIYGLLALEVILRIMPTKHNLSNLDFMRDLLNSVFVVMEKYVPNNRKL